MTESYSKAANLLGALALAVCDRLREATEHLDDGLAASEPAALVTLAHYPGQSILTLGRTLGLTHSGAVRLADRLEASGLVRRAPSGRGRTLALSLTQRGRSAALQALARRQAAVEARAGMLGPGEGPALARRAAGPWLGSVSGVSCRCSRRLSAPPSRSSWWRPATWEPADWLAWRPRRA